jgi:hypothetical protein
MFDGGLFIVGFVVAFAFAGLIFFLFASERVTIKQFIFWELVALGLLVASVFPALTDWAAGLLGITARGIFVLSLAVLGAYVFTFSLSISQRINDKTIRLLIQEIALLRYQLEYGSDESSSHDRSPERG